MKDAVNYAKIGKRIKLARIEKDMTQAAGNARIVSSKEILFDSDGGNNMITPETEIDSWIASWK